jgi:hypothetical protein
MDQEHEIRQRLAEVDARSARLTAAVNRVQGERDTLVRQLLDAAGAESCRFVGARCGMK